MTATAGSGGTQRAVLHGFFALEVEVRAPVSEVFAAFAGPERRQRWIRLPSRALPGPAAPVEDGGVEVLRSALAIGDRVERVEGRTHFARLAVDGPVIFTYQAWVNEALRWASLVTVELAAGAAGTDPAAAGAGVGPGGGGTTALLWTEQYAFAELTGDSGHDVVHLHGGTRMQLTALAVSLGAPPQVARLR